jgi:hypothetical protein
VRILGFRPIPLSLAEVRSGFLLPIDVRRKPFATSKFGNSSGTVCRPQITPNHPQKAMASPQNGGASCG